MEAYDKFSIQIPLCLSWNLAVLQTPDFTFVLSSTVLFILLHPKIPKAITAFFPRLLVVFFFFLPVLAHYSICMWEKPLVFKVYSNQIYHLLQVAGKSQFWFHLGTVSLTCFSLLLFLQSYVMSCLRESCTSAWLVSVFVQNPVYLLMAGRKKWKHPLAEACHSEIFARSMAFLLCLFTCPHLWSMKEPDIQTFIRWLFWDISLHLFSQLALWIKSYSLPQHLTSDSLVCCVESRVSLGFIT